MTGFSLEILASWRDYLELCKPKVVMLMLITAIVGMYLSSPHAVDWHVLLFGTVGIACAAAAAAVLNHVADRHIDAVMRRTHKRPVAMGKIMPQQAIGFALILASMAVYVLAVYVNVLTACLSFITLIMYACIYTLFLKRATPQNIVIGGIAGAAPPLLGWTAVTGHISPQSLLLMLIIFTWTPPHFWSLAIYRFEDYRKAKIPMLPVTHGIAFTKLAILLYTMLLIAITLMPFVIRMSGWIYLVGALLLGVRFLYWVIKLIKSDESIVAMKTFRFSSWYLMLLFLLMLGDHYLNIIS